MYLSHFTIHVFHILPSNLEALQDIAKGTDVALYAAMALGRPIWQISRGFS